MAADWEYQESDSDSTGGQRERGKKVIFNSVLKSIIVVQSNIKKNILHIIYVLCITCMMAMHNILLKVVFKMNK